MGLDSLSTFCYGLSPLCIKVRHLTSDAQDTSFPTFNVNNYCCRNSRLAADEDDSKWVKNQRKLSYIIFIKLFVLKKIKS